MSYLRSVNGSSAFLHSDDPSTWDIIVRLERHHKYCSQDTYLDLQLYEYEGWDAKAIALGLRADIVEDDGTTRFVEAVEDVDTWAGSRLRTKIQALESFPFRVLSKHGQKPDMRSDTDDRASFICLSYRWWSDWIHTTSGKGFPLTPALRIDGYHGNFDIPEKKFPISDCMWNALLAERSSESEGIWVDQMCLTQTDNAEVHSAVSSMNILYMSARKVVIVLEDVLLWSDEVRPMIKHAEQINSVPIEDRKKWTAWTIAADPLVLGASACALFKIEGSSWFRRVWCNHELLTGREFTFLIPVMEREPPAEGVDNVAILKLDAKALATFIEASRHLAAPEGLTAFLWRGWVDNIQEDKHVGNEPRVFYGFNAATNFSKKVDTPETTLIYKAHNWPTFRRSAMELLSDALLFDEANPRDVLAVLLNTTHPTLAYRGLDPTIPEIVWLINITALAHGDPSPLLASCRLKNWSDKKITDVPFERYSWAAWPDRHFITSKGMFGEGRLYVKHEIVDEGLKLVVAATGSSNTINQLQDLQSRLGPIQAQFAKLLQFNKRLELEQRKAQEGTPTQDKDLAKEMIEVNSKYSRHFGHAFLYVMAIDPDTIARIHEELSSNDFVPRNADIPAGIKAWEEFPESFKSFDVDTESDDFAQLCELYQPIQPLVKFVEALVTCLIAPEFYFDSTDEYDDDIYISMIKGYNQVGGEWTVLAGLPSESVHGFYWLVRPHTLVEASDPRVQEETGVGIDFRFGGTWAVQAEGLEDGQAQSIEIWNETGNKEDSASVKELDKDALKMKLISRNIRMLPLEPWNRPLYTKTVIIHA